MKKTILITMVMAAGFLVGAVAEKKVNLISHVKSTIKSHTPWDNTHDQSWGSAFNEVSIPSSLDNHKQKAMFLGAKSKSPLIISLHTWSGDYKQHDPLSVQAEKSGWNYIHPDFRGPNWTEDACLSSKSLTDIDDAISYAIDNGNVDKDNIFVVGVSGGGYATLGAFIQTKYSINTFMSWVPISDLNLWYKQSSERKSGYANNILSCTGSGNDIDIDKANNRSPLQWPLPKEAKRIEIYTGIDDGHTGSVPVSQSILFFNKLAKHYDQSQQVTSDETIMLLDRTIDRDESQQFLGDRKLLFSKNAGPAALYVFDGSHEMITDYAFKRLQSLVQ